MLSNYPFFLSSLLSKFPLSSYTVRTKSNIISCLKATVIVSPYFPRQIYYFLCCKPKIYISKYLTHYIIYLMTCLTPIPDCELSVSLALNSDQGTWYMHSQDLLHEFINIVMKYFLYVRLSDKQSREYEMTKTASLIHMVAK